MRRLSIVVGLVMTLAAPALAVTGVQVHIPDGIRTGFVTVAPGPDAQKYVVVENAVVRNPSQYVIGAYRVNDFSLVVGERRYHPVVRPGLAAIDLGEGGVLGPHESITKNLVFLVPLETTRAALEFVPQGWVDSYGRPVIFCCLP